MKVIASRFGSHFSYLCRRNRRRIIFFIILFVVFPMLIYILISVRNNIMPLAFAMAESKAKAIGTVIINETVSSQILSENIEYGELFDIQKNSSGDISAIIANTAKMNLLKARISEEIQDKINKLDTDAISIPVGSMLNNELTAGRGPRIPLKLVTVGAMEMDFWGNFTAAGINQTKHDVHLNIKLTISVILPTASSSAEITSSIPIAQTIIVGKVPDAYAAISN